MDIILLMLLNTSASELQIVQMFYRLLELVTNIAMILGPIFIVLGIAVWKLTGSPTRSKRGVQMFIGGLMLLFLVYGLLEALIGLADWVTSV